MEQKDILQVQGINSKGYGIIAKLAMQDRRLTVTSKAIYAYFCSFAGASRTAFPSRAKITYDLGINKDTYHKHFNLLKQHGYITVDQEKCDNGKYNRNIYTLLDTVPCPNFSDTAPCPKFSDPVFSDPVKPDINNNNSKINNTIINSVSERESAPAPTKNTYGEFAQVRLTATEYEKLVDSYGRDKTLDYINRLDRQIMHSGKQYPNHYATIKKWIDEDGRKQTASQQRPANTYQNRFVNFKQRDWDYAKIERMEREYVLSCLAQSGGKG